MVKLYRLLFAAAIVTLVVGAARVVTLDAPANANVLSNVEYGKGGDVPLLMDVALPDGESSGKRPVVVWIHGGGWEKGDRSPNVAAWMTKNGYVAVSIEYRLSNKAKFPAQIHDCKAAIRFLRAHAKEYGIDPDRIGVWGASAGGHLAALLGTTADIKELEGAGGNPGVSSRVQAVCDFFGPTDLGKLAGHVPFPTAVSRLLGGLVSEKQELAKQASPMSYISKDDAPTLIVHGKADLLVTIKQSEMFHDALKKAGVDVKLIKVKNAGHGFTDGCDPSREEIQQEVLRFFDRTLKNRKN